MDIMVVVAHLDDEIFGMGGTLVKLALENRVKVVCVCKGNDWDLEDDVFKRKVIFSDLCRELKITSHVLEYSDTKLDTIPQTDIINSIDEIYTKFRPEIVYTHSKDLHKDHYIVSECMDVVCRPRQHASIEKLYHFAIPGNVDWSRNDFIQNTFVDISESNYAWRKKEYILKYRRYPDLDPLSYQKMESRDEYYGAIIGVRKAECFQLIFDRSL